MEPTSVALSDKTRVGDTTWDKLKKKAKNDNYRDQSWFNSLTSKQKDLFKNLREAQKQIGWDKKLQTTTSEEQEKLLEEGEGVLNDKAEAAAGKRD